MLPKQLISWVLVFLVGCALRRDGRSSTTGAALQGYDEADERIVGGEPVDPPYKYSSLLCLRWTPDDDAKKCSCGATILDDRWALTAAHCAAEIYESAPGDYYFIAGEHNTRLEEGPEQRVGIKYPIIHEDYNLHSDVPNDIALVRVSTSFRFNNMVNPVNLPPSTFFVSENQSVIGHAVGWGRTQVNGSRPIVVQEVAVPLLTTERCQLLLEDFNITDDQLCAGYDEGGKDACSGDSGGPLYINDAKDGSIIQAGIVSWGKGCAEPETPGVYVNVVKYLDWIEKHRNLVAVYDEVAAAGLKPWSPPNPHHVENEEGSY